MEEFIMAIVFIIGVFLVVKAILHLYWSKQVEGNEILYDYFGGNKNKDFED